MISLDTELDAANNWESEVDIVLAKIPERMTPAIKAKPKPCVLNKWAIRTIAVSESDPTKVARAPSLDIAIATIPINTETNIEITTQMVATRRDNFN